MSRKVVCVAGALLALLAGGCERAGRGGAARPASAASGAGLQVELSAPSGVAEGENELRVHLRDSAGAPVDDARVELDFSMAMAGMPPMSGAVEVSHLGGGEYLARAQLAMAGTWQVQLKAERPSGESVEARGSVRTGSAVIRLEPESKAAAAGAPSPAAAASVRIAPERLQRIGVRFAEVERTHMEQRVHALGRVTWNEAKLVDVAPRVSGFVRDLRADALGVRVTRGEPLFSIYSPELVAAQSEYLSARASHIAELESAAGARLQRFGVAAADVAALERRGAPIEAIPVRSPASGFVIEKNVVEGAAFEAGARLFRIGPLDTVWIEGEVYGSDLAALSVGQTASVSSPALPGRSADARVAAILPSLASESRTARFRLELGNGDLGLRPEMWVDVDLRVDLGERVVVPASAVIVSGERRVAFVDRGNGLLEPRLVQTGVSNVSQVEIRSGLEPGERVVSSGNFLIAAESRVQSALEQW